MNLLNYKYRRLFLSLLAVIVCSTGFLFTSCDDDDDLSTELVLNSYGPMPVARGGELRFIGENLDLVTSIILPNDLEIVAADFTEQSADIIKLTVPQTAMPGYVEVISSNKTITTKTPIGYSEPINIEGSFTPTSVRPGDLLTINGDYLNLVAEVIFTDRVVVDSTAFTSQSREELSLMVPAEAQTGLIAVSNGADNPIIIYSKNELTIVAPTIASIPTDNVKAGSEITIEGTDLDLVTAISFGGDQVVTEFSLDGTSKLTTIVPALAQDGVVTFSTASGLAITSATELTLLLPTLSVSPIDVKSGAQITVVGTDLDLVTSVVFANEVEGVIADGATATSITVTVPDAAVTGEIIFNTASTKTVSGGVVNIISPVISALSDTEGKPNMELTITGGHLDVVAAVEFAGVIQGTISSQTETSIVVTIPVGAETGAVTLIALNGTTVQSALNLTILSNLPTFDSYDQGSGVPGQLLTINGSDLSLVKQITFPGGAYATAYGEKTDEMIEVYVPEGVALGLASISYVTYEGEQGIFPELFFGATDPITSNTIMISDFNGGGASQSTWGGCVSFGAPAVDLDGSAAMLGTSISAWDWAWAHNWDTRPVIDNPQDYVIKYDVCITKAAPGVTGGICLKGWDTAPSLGDDIFAEETGGAWITVTLDVLTEGMIIDGTGDWGIWLNVESDVDLSGVMIDNLRFDPK